MQAPVGCPNGPIQMFLALPLPRSPQLYGGCAVWSPRKGHLCLRPFSSLAVLLPPHCPSSHLQAPRQHSSTSHPCSPLSSHTCYQAPCIATAIIPTQGRGGWPAPGSYSLSAHFSQRTRHAAATSSTPAFTPHPSAGSEPVLMPEAVGDCGVIAMLQEGVTDWERGAQSQRLRPLPALQAGDARAGAVLPGQVEAPQHVQEIRGGPGGRRGLLGGLLRG